MPTPRIKQLEQEAIREAKKELKAFFSKIPPEEQKRLIEEIGKGVPELEVRIKRTKRRSKKKVTPRDFTMPAVKQKQKRTSRQQKLLSNALDDIEKKKGQRRGKKSK